MTTQKVARLEEQYFPPPRQSVAPVRSLRALTNFIVQKPLGGFGVILIALVILVAFLAPFIQRYEPDEVFVIDNPAYDAELAEKSLTDRSIRFQYPPEKFEKTMVAAVGGVSADHWLGTDTAGRDVYARMVWGAQLSLLVGVGAALIAISLGTLLGTISAYFGGAVDMVIQRITDTLQAFPALILLLLFLQVVENANKYHMTLALGIVGIAAVIRVVRSAVLRTRAELYIEAARVVGATDARVMVRHILPNIMAPTIVIFTISIGSYIVAEASLAFIGFGDPAAISWGKMVNEGRKLFPASYTMSLVAGGAITLTVLGFNLAGDALRDVLDPRMRGAGKGGY
ncbi:MAG: ABC transporter permease [Dehalococcoidia bacterium]|nr:ABC transporter permease [Dehalococcoidia bacterium]